MSYKRIAPHKHKRGYLTNTKLNKLGHVRQYGRKIITKTDHMPYIIASRLAAISNNPNMVENKTIF